MAPRILIAEDNDQIAAPMEAFLRRHGMCTERVRDGVEALGRIAVAPPDLLILDLRLPRLHGVELLKKLHASPRTRALPVIVCTGAYRGEHHARVARRLGVAAYLEKPFRGEALLAAVRRALSAQPQPQQATVDLLLLQAFSKRFSGRYLLQGDEERSLLLLNGLPVALRPGFVHRDFGDYLHRKGILTAAEYTYYRGEGQHQHETLVQMGCLDYPELLQEKLTYLSTELVAAFAAPPLAVTEATLAVPPELQVITVNIPEILYQGYRRHGLAAGKALLERHSHHYVATSEAFFRHINFLSLSAEELALLDRFDGRSPLAACLDGRDGFAPLLQTLAALEMVRFAATPIEAAGAGSLPLRVTPESAAEGAVPPEAPLESFADLVEQAGGESAPPLAARPTPVVESPLTDQVREAHAELHNKNHYEVFGLKQGEFSFDSLKERYFAITRRYGPEVLMQLTGEEATLVEEILATVATAYNTLSDVVKKERYDELLGSEKVGLGQEGDDRFQARVQFQSGQVFIGMQDWEGAEKALQDACSVDPNSGAYLAHLAWAIYRNPKNEASQAMREKAWQMLNRALVLERTAPGFAFKGWMLLERGQGALAEAEFNKALKLDTRQAVARRGLQALREQQEQEKRGLFRKMFR